MINFKCTTTMRLKFLHNRYVFVSFFLIARTYRGICAKRNANTIAKSILEIAEAIPTITRTILTITSAIPTAIYFIFNA